jgi:hypothetical protein
MMVIKLVVLVLLPCLSLSLSPESVSLVSFNLQFFSSYSHQLSGLEEKKWEPNANPQDLQTQIELQNVGSRPGRLGSGLTRRVDRVSSGQLPDGFLLKPGPVPDPGRTSLGSTCRAGPGFKIMLPLHIINVNEQTMKL